MPADNIIQFRQGTASQWSAANPVLSNGEMGYETDTRRSKVGDGVTAWNALAYNVLNPSGLLAGSGINISLGTNNSTATINVSGLNSSYISNFSTSVSGLLPTISNSGDNRLLTNTGSSVGINAESNLVFDGSRLGINTATPSGSLHVIGTGLISSLTSISPNSLLHLYSATSGDRIFNVEGTNGSLFSVDDNLSGTLMSVNNSAGLPVFEVFSDDRIIGGRFNQNDFVINSSGNVGIGNSGDNNYKLSVTGKVNVNGSLLNVLGSGSFSSGLLVSGGNVGIGTQSPTAPLHVIGSGFYSTSDSSSIITIDPSGRSIDCSPSAFSDINLKANNQNIFRGLDGWSGTWSDSAATTYFQVGRNGGNTIFTSFVGAAFNRLAYSANKILFTNNNSNLSIPTGYFTIGANINGGSVGTSGLVIDTTHASPNANGQSHGGLVITSLFNTGSSNLNNIYGAYIAPRHSGTYTTTNSYGLYVNAATNISGIITNNYAAVFNGGNVGIGTTNPQYSLDVNGSANIDGLLNVSGIPLSEVIDDKIANLLVAGTGISINYNDTNNQLVLSSENYYGANRGIIEVSSPTSSFNIPGGYTVGGFDLFLNGVKLVNDIDFTATNGNSINTSSPIPSGSVLEYISLTLANPLRIASDQYSAEISREIITVTGSLSTINIIGGYDSGGLDVYKDGLKLIKDIQYSANNGSSISLTTPATSGSVIEYVSFLAGKARRSLNTITNSVTAGTIPQTDYIYVATTPNITVTMPSAVGNNNRYTIKNLSNGTINVAPPPGQTIDNQSIISIINQYTSIDIVSNNQNWIII